MKKPVVALVGRPNVGKSTLFNRLVGERMAIVDDVPGTTRDRLMAEAEWNGRLFNVVDTGGIDPSIGGDKPLSIGSSDFISQIRSQALIAIQEADVILFLVDADAGVTPADTEVANILRKNQLIDEEGKPFPPIFLVVNKTDNERLRKMTPQFYEMGLGDPYPISALHGTETGDLLDDLVAVFPDVEEEDDDSVKVAIVGKPNVGKSSLLNRMIGEDRSIVSPIAGTTRDAVDTKITFQDIPITLIDTAGIRRRGKIEVGVEKFSVIRAMQAIERCDVALLVIDAESGISAQDAHIAGYILQEWKSTVVVVNKWDLIVKDNHTMNQFNETIRRDLNFMSYVPILYISAKTGQRVEQVLPMALRVQEERIARITTGQLNRILQNAQERHASPSHGNQQLKIYYANQVRSNPPTFLIHVNDPKLAHFSYIRYLENCIRKEFEFLGTPIRLVLKARR